ncbi:hypothetical protein [Robiginitalea biformata]|uniref:Uncharacterized protein n=1 Tax=Robiginitalea biformata (strain ATCC BAA-864 / DSM 15991 / KCTC 12146 / HTCC2501) TaxID=313596 RepID=A4CI81_ROBBH|nr:hypothetical protein [Robiginitalea biformata]EAR16639.1 hypothetical protein RB2501_07055 [Robiginitalea biformata HTCC2501]
MQYYYDTQPYYPYICLNDTTQDELKSLVAFLDKEGLKPTKFYSDPKYPASNGTRYRYLFRLPFVKTKTGEHAKPDSSKVQEMLDMFMSLRDQSNHLAEGKTKSNSVSASEVNYLKQVIGSLQSEITRFQSERKMLESDKSFLKSQMVNLEKITHVHYQENQKIIASLSGLSDKLSADIDGLLGKSGANSMDMDKLLASVKKREETLKEREKKAFELEKEVLKAHERLEELEKLKKEEFEERERILEEDYRRRVDELRASDFGIDKQDDSFEDPYDGLQILCTGATSLASNDITKVIGEEFDRIFSKWLSKKHIEIVPEYNIKNSNVLQKIKSGKYNYVILGPIPHSNKGGNAKQSVDNLTKDLDTKIFTNYDCQLSKNFIKSCAKESAELWKKQLENKN